MFFKQAAAHVAVEAEGEIFVDVDDALLHCVYSGRQGEYHNGSLKFVSVI